MRFLKNRKGFSSSESRLVSASIFALEALEVRQLLSTTLAAWTFDNLATTTGTPVTLSPAVSSGTGTALSIGMQSTNANGYQYPATGAAGNADISYILNGSGNNGATDYSSSGARKTAHRTSAMRGKLSAAPVGAMR